METFDLRGTRCPLTLLKIKQFLYQANSSKIQFLFDDVGASIDLPLYLQKESKWHLELNDHISYFEAICTLTSTHTSNTKGSIA